MKYTQKQWDREIGWGKVPEEFKDDKPKKKKKEKQPKRTLVLEGIGTELDLGKIVQINTDKKMIVFEEMSNGQWRFTFSSSVIDDPKKLTALKIVREEE